MGEVVEVGPENKKLKCCAKNGYDLLIAANEPEIQDAAKAFRAEGIIADAGEVDLATQEGVDRLRAAAAGRPVEALLANARRGLGGGFLDQDFEECEYVLDTNITGTLYLIHNIGREMRSRGKGKILITGSIAGHMPGSFQAVYNGTKAFLDSFALALRNELKDTGVTVTCLLPGATESEFFRRADMLDTKVGTDKNADPADVAKLGFEAMQKGESQIVTGMSNKLQVAMSHILPGDVAEQHRKIAEPGTAKKGH